MKKETRDRLMFGLPLGYGSFLLSNTSFRVAIAFAFYLGVILELENFNR